MVPLKATTQEGYQGMGAPGVQGPQGLQNSGKGPWRRQASTEPGRWDKWETPR